MKSVGNELFNAAQASSMLETDVETLRRMVVEDRTLKATFVSRQGDKKPFHFNGLRIYTVNHDCSVTDYTNSYAGDLRFDVLELLPFRESLVNSAEASAISANQAKKDAPRRRYEMCIAAGLKMPTNPYGRLPRGIKALAAREGISTQAFSKSVKKYMATLH